MSQPAVHSEGPDDLSGESNAAESAPSAAPAAEATPTAPEPKAPATPKPEVKADQTPEPPLPEAPSKVDELPAWAQQHISDLRRENATQRDRRKAAEDRAETAETSARTAAESQIAKIEILADRNLDRSRFLPMLTGDSPEAWEAAADALVELRGAAQTPPSVYRADPAQAANPSPLDPHEQAAQSFFSGLSPS